jgi:hypothetical protein
MKLQNLRCDDTAVCVLRVCTCNLLCRSAKLFQQQVAPVLEDAAGMQLSRVVTQHAGHVSQLTAQLSLAAVDMLVFVGGDGTVFEGLQVTAAASGVCMLHVGSISCVCPPGRFVCFLPADLLVLLAVVVQPPMKFIACPSYSFL